MRGYYGYGFSQGAGFSGAAGFPWIAVVSWIVGIIFIAALIYFAVKLSRASLPKGDASLEILASRLARGEITKEEYSETREFLKKN